SITFNNAPAVGAVLNASGNASASTWIDVDVTAHVTGDGLISFGLTTADNGLVSVSSREGSNPPELVIETSGGPAPTPTNTPEPGPTATPTNTPIPPTPTNTPVPGNDMHVSDLDGTSVRNGRIWTATITVYVEDDSGNPVSDATVSGTWNIASNTDSCTTNGSGSCTVTSGDLFAGNHTTTYTVDDITHSSLSYSAGDNTDPDGDSDGTTITVNRP
ncbi:MAG: hypothetical protein GY943_01245, partial [Chloroflexi bacterium]|nr:hypothetical protein [Chloroflexota bacterium]